MSPVTLTIENDVATIQMDDGKANAFNNTMFEALEAALDTAEADAKAIVIAGRPERFSGGFDLKIMLQSSPEEVVALVNRGGTFAYRLYNSRLPIVAACTGHAIAMGVFALLACDTRIGASGPYMLGANETINNMVLPPFAFELVNARLAKSMMTRAVIQAELFSPDDAVSVGYLDKVVAPDAVLATAQELAGKFAQLPPAYGGNKRELRRTTLDAMAANLPV